MTAWGLAWRTIARSPARSVLAVAGVTVIGALLFNMLLLSRGLLVSFRDLLDNAGYDIRVIAAEGSMAHRAPIADATALAKAIASLPDVESIALVRTDLGQVSAPGKIDAWTPIELIGMTDSKGGGWTIVKGSPLPTGPSAGEPPVVVNTTLASRLHLEPGSRLRLRLTSAGSASALPLVTVQVIGVGGFAFEAAGDLNVATTMAGFAVAHGTPADRQAEMVLVASRPGAAAAWDRRGGKAGRALERDYGTRSAPSRNLFIKRRARRDWRNVI
jgi:hypothetical protein